MIAPLIRKYVYREGRLGDALVVLLVIAVVVALLVLGVAD